MDRTDAVSGWVVLQERREVSTPTSFPTPPRLFLPSTLSRNDIPRLTTCPPHHVPQHLVLAMCRPRDGRGHGLGHHPDAHHRLQRGPHGGVDDYHVSEPEADDDYAVGCYRYPDAG